MDAARIDERLTELAYHFVQAAPVGESTKGTAYSRRAGDHALATFSYEEAARHYEQALSLAGMAQTAERFELLIALADAHLKAGDREAGRAATEQATTIARTLGDPQRLAQAALIYGGLSWSSGTVDETRIRLFEEAASGLTDGDALRARVLAGLVYALYWTGDQTRMSVLSEEALTLARRSGDQAALADALVARHSDRWAPEHAEERQSVAAEMIRLASVTRRTDLEMQGRLWLVRDLAEQTELTEAVAQLDRFEQRATELRQPLFLWRAATCRAALSLLRGQFAEAERLMQQALAIGRRATESGAAIHFAAQLFALRAEQGRFEEVLPAEWSDTSLHAAAPVLRAARTFQHFACGRLATARAELDHLAADHFAALRVDLLNWAVAVTYLAPVCAAFGDRHQIESLYGQMRPHAGRVVCGSAFATAHGSMARSLGVLATALGRSREAEEHFEQALATNERLGALPQIAGTRLDYAEMLIGRGRPGDIARATALLTAALDVARSLGMAGVIERIERVAAGTSRTVEPAGSSGVPMPGADTTLSLPDPLTSREVEVLRLVAFGRSSTQIAAELVLSTGTVRKHIANIYAKIGAHGKAEATAYAIRHGLL
jgi:DNA-binding CsgD family transcriptional regulator